MAILSWVQRKLIVMIPVMMLLGLFFGVEFEASILKSAIVPLTFLMVYPMMINLQLRKVFEGSDFGVQLITQVINFAVIPFVTYLIAMFFFSDKPYLALGLLLTGLLPTSGMTISWTGMAKGNVEAAVKMTVIGLILGSLLAPLYIKLLMGASIEVDMLGIFKQIVLIVLLPLILGNITQRIIIYKYGMKRYQSEIKQKLPSFSTLGVLGIVFVAMALKAKGIFHKPEILLDIIAPLIILYVLNFIISVILGKLFFKRNDAIALLYGTVMRNLSIALAIAMTAFGREGSDIALVIALGYIIQVQSAAWFVKLTERIYGVYKVGLNSERSI